jgi:hypothetical protein
MGERTQYRALRRTGLVRVVHVSGLQSINDGTGVRHGITCSRLPRHEPRNGNPRRSVARVAVRQPAAQHQASMQPGCQQKRYAR